MTSPAEVLAHPMAEQLFVAWHGANPDDRAELATLPPPGAIALRCRYRHLMDTVSTGARLTPIERSLWDQALLLETEGDLALVTGDFQQARSAFETLRGLANGHHVLLTNALIGLGDVLRGIDEVEQATAAYEAALDAAEEEGYRFGRMRALVGAGHLLLNFHTATAAQDRFTQAQELAFAVGDPLYQANAVHGVAETLDRLGNRTEAIEGFTQAYRLFSDIGSQIGRAHTAQRLGALLHRLDRIPEATEWHSLAAKDFEQLNDRVGQVNTLDGLGDLLLDQGDYDAAEIRYQESFTIAGSHRLPIARANALQNLARVARARANWTEAEHGFDAARAAYRQVGDLLGMSNALDKLAESRVALGRNVDALRARVEAVFVIEEYRAANTEPAAQTEYRRRFARTYAEALRAAVDTNSATAFAVIADGLAGRRLAGLATAEVPEVAADETALIQEMLVRADRRWLSTQSNPMPTGMELPAGTTREERRLRMLGALGLRRGLVEPAETAVETLLSGFYLPPVDEGADLLASLPTGCHALQVLVDPVDDRLIHWLWRDDDGQNDVGTTTLSEECAALLAVLREDTMTRSDLRPNQLIALGELLPGQLRTALAEHTRGRLLLVPVGDLWLVPWGAVPLADRVVLGACAEFVVCPSLSLQRTLQSRGSVRPVDRPTSFWRSPLMDCHSMAALHTDPRWTFANPASASEAKTLLGSGAHTMIIVCHGRLLSGVGHYLELDVDTWLLPADVYEARPPHRLYLITCWGAGVPGNAMTDPVSVATLALAKGSHEILATVGDFGDTEDADLFVQWVLEGLHGITVSASLAVHRAIRRTFEHSAMWHQPLRDWGPLLPIGTFHEETSATGAVPAGGHPGRQRFHDGPRR